jgi:hypothetical protein
MAVDVGFWVGTKVGVGLSVMVGVRVGDSVGVGVGDPERALQAIAGRISSVRNIQYQPDLPFLSVPSRTCRSIT